MSGNRERSGGWLLVPGKRSVGYKEMIWVVGVGHEEKICAMLLVPENRSIKGVLVTGKRSVQ